MTGNKQQQERLALPGQEPTEEDLRHDVDLTRRELAETVDALAAKADVKARVRSAKTDMKARMRYASRQPVTAVAGAAALIALIALWWLRSRR
jgi:hypothetical protein